MIDTDGLLSMINIYSFLHLYTSINFHQHLSLLSLIVSDKKKTIIVYYKYIVIDNYRCLSMIDNNNVLSILTLRYGL